jgi:hypothetical protein
MMNAIFGIVLIAAIGSLSVPVIMLTLARFGYFEPIRFCAFGRVWNFSPKSKSPYPIADATILTFPFQRQTIFASVVTAAYTVAAPTGVIDGMRHLETGAIVSGTIRDVRKMA